MFTLEVKARDVKNRPDGLRRKGLLPAVYYGAHEKATPVALSMSAFKKVWKEAGESSIISLETPGGKIDALLQDIQLDPVTGEPLHADFYAVDQNVAIEVRVPIEFEGVSPVVKDQGATLIKVLHDVGIKALPKDLPQHFTVDIGTLATLEDVITVDDIKPPKGVELTEKPGTVIASLAAEREEEEEPVAPVDLSAIEVEKRGKEEEAPGEEAAPAPEEK